MCRSGEWSPYDVCVDEAEKEEMKRIVNLCKENASHIGQVRSLLGNNLTIRALYGQEAPNGRRGVSHIAAKMGRSEFGELDGSDDDEEEEEDSDAHFGEDKPEAAPRRRNVVVDEDEDEEEASLSAAQAEQVVAAMDKMRRAKTTATAVVQGWHLTYTMRPRGGQGDMLAVSSRGDAARIVSMVKLRKHLGLQPLQPPQPPPPPTPTPSPQPPQPPRVTAVRSNRQEPSTVARICQLTKAALQKVRMH